MNPLHDYFRCPVDMCAVGTRPGLSARPGYFRFEDAVAFGRIAGHEPAAYATDSMPDVSEGVLMDGDTACLPFDLSEVAANLREERYRLNRRGVLQAATNGTLAQHLYYLLRPFMRVGVRRHLQKLRLRGWDRIAFPHWPVDATVDTLMEKALVLVMTSQGLTRMPFIWFWPDQAPACVMMTHDIEGQSGIDFCDELMSIDDSHGVKSAFQLIPQGRADAWRQTAARLRSRGFEVNLHDLNHDGQLFAGREAFDEQARKINAYAREYRCDGFRSGAMYREQGWYGAFEFAYDMSVPNVAHLEPQRGGCCTVMPYFVGNVLELPLTTVQDYSLFFILGDYSTRLWEQQIDLITQHHGLISVIAHPDYLVGAREREVYEALLRHISELRDREAVWVALPGEINRWWRNRAQMTLVPDGAGWAIEGPDSDRAHVAYASLGSGQLAYSFEPTYAGALA